MSVEQLAEQIQRLPQQDLARLVGRLDRLLDRQAPQEPGEATDLTDDEKAEQPTSLSDEPGRRPL